MEEDSDSDILKYLSTVEMSHDGKNEVLEEKIVKLSEHPDPLIKCF